MAKAPTMTLEQLRELPIETRVRAVEILGLVAARCSGCRNVVGSPDCKCGEALDVIDAGRDVASPDEAAVEDTFLKPETEVEAQVQEETADETAGEVEVSLEPLFTCDVCGDAVYVNPDQHDCTGTPPDAE